MALSPKSLGAGLRLVREEANLQAKQLADIAGVAASQISEVETGKRTASIGFLERIAPALGLSPWTLQRRIEDLALVIEGGPNALNDAPPPFQINPPNLPSFMGIPPGEMSDYEALARHLLKDLPQDRLVEMIHEFTKLAAGGDRDASKRARALLEIITPPK